MIINKEGKLFGKVSIIDIAVVLIIAILVAGIAFKFSGGKTSVVSGNEKIECTLFIKNVRMYTVDALKKGGSTYDDISKEKIGEITDVRYEEGEYQVNMADGSFKPVVPEDKYNVYVTVAFEGKISDDGYYTKSNKYLAVGTTVGAKTKYAHCQSTVYSIGEAE